MTLDWKALDKPKLSKGERKTFAKAILADFKVFCKVVGPPKWDFTSANSGHIAMVDALCSEDKSADGIIRIHVQAPRKGGKSALCQRHAAWRICRSVANWPSEPYKNGSIRILYAAENVGKAEEAGKWVHEVLSDPKSNLVKVFGQIVLPSSSILEWTSTYRANPHPHPTWATGSPGKSTAGKHPLLIYADDTETDRSTRTIDGMMMRRRWLDELEAELETEGEIRVMGTPYDDNDLYSYIHEKGDLWKCSIFHVEHYTFLGLTPEFLEGKRAVMPISKFSASYLLDPLPAEVRVFTRDLLHMVKYDDRIKALPRYILLDVATKKEGRCETAMWIVAKDAMDTAYGIDLVHGFWEPSVMLDHLVALFNRWNARWFCAEDRVLTSFLRELVLQKGREVNVHMPFHVASGKHYPGKDEHIQMLRPRLRANRLLFCDSLPKKEIYEVRVGKTSRVEGDLVRTFTRFPKGKLKDVLDALAYIDRRDEMDGMLVPRPPKAKAGSWTPEKTTRNPWRFPAWKRAGRR